MKDNEITRCLKLLPSSPEVLVVSILDTVSSIAAESPDPNLALQLIMSELTILTLRYAHEARVTMKEKKGEAPVSRETTHPNSTDNPGYA